MSDPNATNSAALPTSDATRPRTNRDWWPNKLDLTPLHRVARHLAVAPGGELRDGLVYVFRGPGGIQIKRLYVEPQHIHIWSDNPDAPRYRVSHTMWEQEYTPLAIALETSTRL